MMWVETAGTASAFSLCCGSNAMLPAMHHLLLLRHLTHTWPSRPQSAAEAPRGCRQRRVPST